MKGMLISTRDKNKTPISYTDALLQGLAPDGGLYVPESYPQISLTELRELKNSPYVDIAFKVKSELIGDFIPPVKLKELLSAAYSAERFPVPNGNIVPVTKISDGIYLQNLSLGPTAAFKDMALQQLGQEMNFELERRDENLVLLGATSGDTGSAAEAALKGLPRAKLFMTSPEVGMSDFQKAQMGALSGDNIFNISIKGRFDDCQDLVKELKKDPEFAKLGAVNSINWGRISSQIPYYFSGYLQVAKKVGDPVDFVVPSGNFGNILSAYVAKKMGLPIRRLIVATNENSVLDTLIKTGVYKLTSAVVTSSPSMDISKSSNYERLVFDLLGRRGDKVTDYMLEFGTLGTVDLVKYGLTSDRFERLGFFSGTSTHADRLNTIRKTFDESGIVIDPHTADGVKVAQDFFKGDGVPMVCMATALSVKFEDTIKEAIGEVPSRPDRFVGLVSGSEGFTLMGANANELKDFIRKNT